MVSITTGVITYVITDVIIYETMFAIIYIYKPIYKQVCNVGTMDLPDLHTVLAQITAGLI